KTSMRRFNSDPRLQFLLSEVNRIRTGQKPVTNCNTRPVTFEDVRPRVSKPCASNQFEPGILNGIFLSHVSGQVISSPPITIFSGSLALSSQRSFIIHNFPICA